MIDMSKEFLMEKRSLLRLVFFLFSDAIFIAVSVLLAFAVRFELNIPSQYDTNILGIIVLALVVTIPIIYLFKLYNFTWLYVSTEELVSLIKAIVLSFLMIAAVFFVLKDQPVFSGFPRSTLFISYFFIFIFSGLTRFSKRIYLQLNKKGGKERTLIVGAGRAGEQILRNISNSIIYNPVGFVDDDPSKRGILIHGLRVFGKIEDIVGVVKKERIEGIIIALPSAGTEIIKQAVEEGRKAGIKKIKIVPAMEDVISGKNRIRMDMLQDLEMGNLLKREPIILDKELIEDFLVGKKILITGAAGSIGSELCQQVAKFRPSLLLVLDQDETGVFNISGDLNESFPDIKVVSLIADIQDKDKLEKIFSQYAPNIVFHAAAYKHVPLMEEFPEEAIKNNVFGTLNLAQVSLANKADKFVFISTDKAVNPTSVMGATKRIGEMICQVFNQKNSTKFISVRFGNVLGSRGSVIPIFREQIKRGGPVKITHSEMKRYFMITSEACLLVMQSGAMGQGGEVFVLDMGDPVRIMDLAKDLIKLAGLEPDKDIPIIFSGSRPGEKLFEELLTAEEGTVSTVNKKIFMAKLSRVEENKLNEVLDKLGESAKMGNKREIIEILRTIIKTYKPN
jgi:FlaA1/EpsC-like NDP-sugar epimerase